MSAPPPPNEPPPDLSREEDVRDLTLRPGWRAGGQVLGLAGLWWGADLAMRALHLPIPGSVAGLGLLVLALRRGWLSLPWVKEGADWLLAEMLLFFIPAVVAV
ncbi:MAG TPA: CidA/LrgA family protein, partial [Holophagaceae bacterium]